MEKITLMLNSPKLQRDSGTSCVAGNSQAKALTCTTSSGGKRPGATRSGTFFQSQQAFLKESLSPLANDFTAGVQASSDLVIGPAFGGVEDHSGANDLAIWQRIFGGYCFQFPPLFWAKINDKWTGSRHEPLCPQSTSLARNKYVSIFMERCTKAAFSCNNLPLPGVL